MDSQILHDATDDFWIFHVSLHRIVLVLVSLLSLVFPFVLTKEETEETFFDE